MGLTIDDDEPFDEEPFDDDGIVDELDNIASARNNYRDTGGLYTHPKRQTKQPLTKGYATLVQNADIIAAFLKRMRRRKGKKPPDINRCLFIHKAMRGRYLLGEEDPEDTVRRIWDLKRLATFARSLWVSRRRRAIAVIR